LPAALIKIKGATLKLKAVKKGWRKLPTYVSFPFVLDLFV